MPASETKAQPIPEEPSSAEEVVRYLFDAFNRRDAAAALTLLHPEIVFEPVTGAILNEGRPYRGHEGMRLYFEHLEGHWHELHVEPVQIRCAGNAVVALGRTNGRGRAGPLVEAPTTWIFKFEDGLVARIQIFSDERLAHRALAEEAIEPLARPGER
jgi:ketosteroid isomerase-like protein